VTTSSSGRQSGFGTTKQSKSQREIDIGRFSAQEGSLARSTTANDLFRIARDFGCEDDRFLTASEAYETSWLPPRGHELCIDDPSMMTGLCNV
tara:strand:- start:1841 stop:2119 length:279 start_codon:yes stop_codon:yes gene_type:complete